MQATIDQVRAAIEAALATGDDRIAGQFIEELYADQLADIYARVEHGAPIKALSAEAYQATYARCAELAAGERGDRPGDTAVAIALALRAQPRLDAIVPAVADWDASLTRIRYQVLYDTYTIDPQSGYYAQRPLFSNYNIGTDRCNLRIGNRLPGEQFYLTAWSADCCRDPSKYHMLTREQFERPPAMPVGVAVLVVGSERREIPAQRLATRPVPLLHRANAMDHLEASINLDYASRQAAEAEGICVRVYLEGFSFES